MPRRGCYFQKTAGHERPHHRKKRQYDEGYDRHGKRVARPDSAEQVQGIGGAFDFIAVHGDVFHQIFNQGLRFVI